MTSALIKAKTDLHRVAMERLTTAYANEKLRRDTLRWLSDRRNGVPLVTREQVMKGG